MAALTPLGLEAARRVAAAHGLPAPDHVAPVPGGTVNSNHLIGRGDARWFVRIYEEQDEAGVAFEARLGAALDRAGVPVARPLPPVGPRPRVEGRPAAVFEAVEGEELCQARVDPGRTGAVGAALAQAHAAGGGLAEGRESRFGRDALLARLGAVEASGRADLAPAVARARGALEALDPRWEDGLPRGLVHGDLFRDNVRWRGARVVALLDWESASEGAFVYDLAVTLLAWCWGDRFDPALARALARGYAAVRAPTAAERAALRDALRFGATRFLVTRLTDVELRRHAVPHGKDYRRFLQRLDEVEALDAADWAALLE